MNNDQVKNIIQGIGLLTELWTITYNGFIQQGLSSSESMKHTKELISIMISTFTEPNGGDEKQ